MAAPPVTHNRSKPPLALRIEVLVLFAFLVAAGATIWVLSKPQTGTMDGPGELSCDLPIWPRMRLDDSGFTLAAQSLERWPADGSPAAVKSAFEDLGHRSLPKL